MHVQIVSLLPQSLITMVFVCLNEIAACNAEGQSYGFVAQKSRAPACHVGGHGFKSRRGRHAAIAQLAERHLAMVEAVGSSPICCSKFGSLAQLVEHPAVNRGVRGSSPLRAAIIWVGSESANAPDCKSGSFGSSGLDTHPAHHMLP